MPRIPLGPFKKSPPCAPEYVNNQIKFYRWFCLLYKRKKKTFFKSSCMLILPVFENTRCFIPNMIPIQFLENKLAHKNLHFLLNHIFMISRGPFTRQKRRNGSGRNEYRFQQNLTVYTSKFCKGTDKKMARSSENRGTDKDRLHVIFRDRNR